MRFLQGLKLIIHKELALIFHPDGGMTYGIYNRTYPAVDISSDSPDSIIVQNWNNFIYDPGEWAYVFISATKYGQVLCYSWPEDDWYRYSIHGWEGEIVISDFWIFSYEELKR